MEAARLPSSNPALRIGEILVRDGHVSTERVEQALARQAEVGKPLGRMLVDAGLVSSRAVAQALAEQFGLEFVDLAVVDVDPAASGLITEGFAREHQALPLRFLADELVQVAIGDPTNLRTSDDLRLALGLSTHLAVADTAALANTISRTYRQFIEVTEEQPSYEEEPLFDAGDHAPTIDFVNGMLGRAVNDGASDIHLDPQLKQLTVRQRLDGVLRWMEPIAKGQQAAVTARVKVMAGLDIAEKRMPQDGSFSILFGGNPVDVRVAVIPTKHGEHVVLRLLHRSNKLELPDLGMGPEAESVFLRSIRQPHGAVITCGPTGSGKTTTLYAALDLLNEETRSIATIEDPVEYQLPGVNQVEVHARIGLTFARGLRTILRSDPEVILVGEIRDEETAQIAIQAAMTGHLVLTTLHTNDAASSIARLKNMGVDPNLLSTSINCIVAQRLARRLCVHCRVPHEASREELLEADVVAAGDSKTLYGPGGCLQCEGTGYQGRVALYELMPIHGLGRILLEGTTDEIFAAATELGMRSLREDGIRQALVGVTSLDEVRRVTGERLG